MMNSGKKETVVTTIGQLNFFRWAIQYQVVNIRKKFGGNRKGHE